HIDRSMWMRVEHVIPDRSIPTLDSGPDPAIRQARARERRRAEIHALAKRGGGRHQLERRTWWIQPVSRAVKERIRGRFCVVCIALRRSGVRPWIARAGEQLARIWIEHDGRRLAGRLLGVARDNRRHSNLKTGVDR